MAGLNKAYKRRPSMVAMNGGPVLCLDAGSKLSYPGSGTTWTDLSGNGNNGTLTNGPTYDSANGGSLVFNGTNQYGVVSNSASISFASALTISIWFYSGSLTSPPYNWIYLKGRTDTDVYNPFIYTDSSYLWTGSSGRAQYKPSAGYISANTWYNLVVSHTSGAAPLIYKNGVLSTTHSFTEGNGTYPLGTNSWRLGICVDIERGLQSTFDGKLSSIIAYNRALSATEISTNFNLLRGRYGI